MTSEIVHGAPGSYKTSALVSLYAIPALQAGRTVVTNIRGFASIERIEEIFDEAFPPGAAVIVIPFDIAGFERMARWFHWAPHGSCILMDEGQRVYPTRLRTLAEFDNNDDNKLGAKSVEEAFDTHRHYNYDIYISTPNIAKIHKEVRQIAEYGYRHKNLKGLLPIPYFNGRFKRVKHDPENSGKSPTHYLGSQVAKIDERAFQLYGSTATNTTKDTESKTSIFQYPKLVFALCLIAVCFIWLGYTATREGGFYPAATVDKTVTSADSGGEVSEISPDPASTLADSNGVFRQLNKDDYVTALLMSITHSSGKIRTRTKKVVWFDTPSGIITDVELKSMNVAVIPLTSYYILEYNDKGYIIPTKLNVAQTQPDAEEQPVSM